MNLSEQVFVWVLTMAEVSDERQRALLQALCRSACAMLKGQMKQELTPEDCLPDFVAAAGLMALAALEEAGERNLVERFTVGDVSVQKTQNGNTAKCLREQARAMMAPYLSDRFAFMGV